MPEMPRILCFSASAVMRASSARAFTWRRGVLLLVVALLLLLLLLLAERSTCQSHEVSPHVAVLSYALETRTLLWFKHGCSVDCMLLEHEGSYGLGIDALVTVCSWNTNAIMV